MLNTKLSHLIGSLGVIFLMLISLLSPSHENISAATNSTSFDLTSTKAEKIARVTGIPLPGETLPDPNKTAENWNLNATDLGVVWDATTDPDDPKVMIAFGDSYDAGWGGSGGGGEREGWRANLLAISNDKDLSDGLSFSSMITEEGRDDYAKEILFSEKNTGGSGDFTVIPNAGVTVGDRHFIHYFQLRKWENWTINHAGIAYSDDEGENWTYSDVKWDTDSNFGFAAFEKHDGFVYMLGAHTGRGYNPHLARVPEEDMLDEESYEYWDGENWIVNDESAAVPILDSPLGEPSLSYNSYYKKWMLVYLNRDRHAIVMRSSSHLTHGWSGETIIAPSKDFPGNYGSYIHPWSDGKDLYFLMSEWGPYNVFLMHSTLGVGEPHKNLLEDPSFSEQISDEISSPWNLEGEGGIDRNVGFSKTGYNNAFLRSESGWNEINQTVKVKPNTDYRLQVWIRTSANNEDGQIGVRDANGNMLGDNTFGQIEHEYSQKLVLFNSGDEDEVTVFAGMNADGDTWIQPDAFLLLEDTPVEMKEDPEIIEDPAEVIQESNQLPKTSTSMYQLVFVGLSILIFGVILGVARKKQKKAKL